MSLYEEIREAKFQLSYAKEDEAILLKEMELKKLHREDITQEQEDLSLLYERLLPLEKAVKVLELKKEIEDLKKIREIRENETEIEKGQRKCEHAYMFEELVLGDISKHVYKCLKCHKRDIRRV